MGIMGIMSIFNPARTILQITSLLSLLTISMLPMSIIAASPSPSPSPSTDNTPSDHFSSSLSKRQSQSQSFATLNTMRKTHGFIMAISFLILLPSFALTLYVIPMASSSSYTTKTASRIHAPLQLATMCLLLTGLGLGVHVEKGFGLTHGQTHPIIGAVVVGVLVVVQPVLGYFHHRAFREQRQRQCQRQSRNEEQESTGRSTGTGTKTKGLGLGLGPGSHLGSSHRWLGRSALVLGIVNGGLGLRLARAEMGDLGASRRVEIAYGVVAGIMGVVYLGVLVGRKFVEARRRRIRTVSAVDTHQ